MLSLLPVRVTLSRSLFEGLCFGHRGLLAQRPSGVWKLLSIRTSQRDCENRNVDVWHFVGKCAYVSCIGDVATQNGNTHTHITRRPGMGAGCSLRHKSINAGALQRIRVLFV